VTGRSPKKLDAEALKNVALRALGSRAHSQGELRQKLLRRAEKSADVDAVLSNLKESGYLDDKRFAESYAAARLENEGHGKTRVLRDLRQRRIAPKLAEQTVAQTFSATDELELIDAYLKRKFRGKDLPSWLSEQKNLMAAFRRLRYAGFSSGNSIGVLKRYAAQAEEMEGVEDEETVEDL
jgi:regulatory protein